MSTEEAEQNEKPILTNIYLSEKNNSCWYLHFWGNHFDEIKTEDKILFLNSLFLQHTGSIYPQYTAFYYLVRNKYITGYTN